MRTAWILLSMVLATPLAAQDLASRIAASRADRVTFTFEGKPGVCGDWDCRKGLVRVTLTVSGQRVLRVRTTVGGEAQSGAEELGQVAPGEAADWLLDLAERGEGRASEEALMPGVVGQDVVVWPRLVAMAKRQDLREETRKQAIFWLGQQAAEHAVGPLEEVLTDDPEREMRQSALFALTQQHSDRSIDILIRTARSHRDPETRRTAFFWLGQSGDPRGIRLFEEVLAGR